MTSPQNRDPAAPKAALSVTGRGNCTGRGLP